MLTTVKGSGTSVTREGLRLPSSARGSLDVVLEGHRLWSFDPRRDGRRVPGGRLVPWPRRLVPYLVGSAHVRVAPHLGGRVLHDAHVAFTDDAGTVAVVDKRGHRLSVDKGGRLERTFDRTDDALRRLIVDTTTTVLAQLRDEAGLEAFLAYGCLLGAVREGRMIGHDCDADVAYLSAHEHPLDIIRENRATALLMERLGHRVMRMSDADFKVVVPLPDGRRCGIDVFTAYHRDGRFHLLPSVSGPVAREDLLPVSTVRIEGRDVVAPKRPEVLLAASYGPGWRTPDPSFRFTPSRALLHHMDDTWRGGRQGTWHWTDYYEGSRAAEIPDGPSDFARWVHDRLDGPGGLVDLGSGTGRDAAWLAAQGHDVVATESSYRARAMTKAAGRRHGAGATSRLDVRLLNLNDVRTTLREAGRLAFDPVPRHVLSRLVLDEVSATARRELYRVADLATRRGGTTYLEVRAGGRTAGLREEITAAGGTVLEEQPGTADGLPGRPTEHVPTLRWAVRWSAPTRDRGETP